MSEPIVIEKSRSLLESQDYYLLRERGLEHIRNLSGKIWTDHNLHDPGITILEILCYALTDLGYRTGFDTRDLLATESGAADPPEESGLFPAHQILTNSPLTIFDYRRLLLKIGGIRNAWLDPMNNSDDATNYRESEVAIYADCHAGELSYEGVNALGHENPRVRLNGLYKVLLELEIDDELGSLNESSLTYRVRRGALKGVELSIDCNDPGFASGAFDFGQDIAAVEVVSVTAGTDSFAAEVDVVLEDSSTVTLSEVVIAVVNDRPEANDEPVPITTSGLDAVLGDDSADGIIPLLWVKQRKRNASLAAVRCVLNAHRNLCEDFLSVEAVHAERIAVCADIDIVSDADIEEVQARVFHAIEQYLNPPIEYYTLEELLDEGMGSEDVFNTPYIDMGFMCNGENVFTKPGFIKSENLEESELRRVVHVSDIINVVMDIEGVVSVRNVLLRKYGDDGNPSAGSEKWCLEVSPNRQPVLFLEKSKLVFFKNETPFRARSTEYLATLDYLRATARKSAYVEPSQVLELPRGQYRDVDAFFSIQHDFPRTYGIGEALLSKVVDNNRVARARQLKAYLTFYDQVLADYLAQLANVRRIFSLEKDLPRTYFSQYLSAIAGVRDEFEDEFYVDKTALQDDGRRTLLTEDEELFQNRRHRVLDHLTARFAEQFTDYVLMMFSMEGDALKTGEELISDKIEFLREYPVLSRERYRAFNYRPENPADVWDTDNVAGLKKRVSRLVGIADYTRRDLTCDDVFEKLFSTRKVGTEFRVEIKDGDNIVIFRSKELFSDRASALSEARKLYPFIRDEDTYVVDDSGGTGQVFYSIRAGAANLENDELFDTEADAVQSIREIIDLYDEILLGEDCSDEGFYIFEHILLRAREDGDPLMSVCIDPDCRLCGDEDPYSFRITVALPYWPGRFSDLEFRRHFERTLREEAPAHVHARICWVDNAQMAKLDRRYRAWLDAEAATERDEELLRTSRGNLIEVLQSLKTVYPAASLHDCAEGADENAVRLGSTNLGMF